MKNESTSALLADVNFLLGGGEMGARMRERDWSKTSLGPTPVNHKLLKPDARIGVSAFVSKEANSISNRAIADIETAGLSPCHIDLLRSLQIRANLVVPILQQERLWGLLIAHQCRSSRQWQQSEINLFNQLAGQAAIAIQQSELALHNRGMI